MQDTATGQAVFCYNIIMSNGPKIIDHTSPYYGNILPNGALIYSQNIVKNIIPNVKTERNWVTINCHTACDDAIFFIHSNLDLEERYDFLRNYKNLVLVASQHSTVEALQKLFPEHKTIYLPLSIDLHYTTQFKNPLPHQRAGTCYAGRPDKPYVDGLVGVTKLSNLTHPDLLRALNDYKYCYAVGLTAIEAKLMGCILLPFDQRYPDVRQWKILDGRQAAKLLQTELDKIDKTKL